MKFENNFKEFCSENGYEGRYTFNNETQEYQIIISKGEDNAGAFLSDEELQTMSNKQINDLLNLLGYGFKQKFTPAD